MPPVRPHQRLYNSNSRPLPAQAEGGSFSNDIPKPQDGSRFIKICRTFYCVKMFHSGVAICIDRVVFSPSRQKMRELFSRASSCLWLTSRSLAKLQSVHCLTTYVRRSLLPGSACGLITRCMRARERARERGLLPSLLRPISERREGGLDGGESVCLSVGRTVFAAATIPPTF